MWDWYVIQSLMRDFASHLHDNNEEEYDENIIDVEATIIDC